ncbi:MAG TPA: FAD binding domain-containing protein [Polyangia bacterium]|nr:FAD binding domain-containing protein [Polyangia bacterium]
MMRAHRFRYHAARSLADAAAALRDAGPGAMLLAGGTDLVPNMKRRQQTPPFVISLRRVPELRGLAARPDGSVAIGACVTLSDLVADAHLRACYRALWRAAAQISTPQLRNMGTLGGNLCLDTRCNYYNQNYEWRKAISFCMKAPTGAAIAQPDGGICWVAPSSPRCWAVSSTDAAPALIALAARVTLTSTQGQRAIPLADLYADDGMTYLTKRPDEILTSVELPPAAAGWRSTYWKLRRRGSIDFPVLGVAAAVRLGAGGAVVEARVVLGAVASHPVVVDTQALLGRPLSDAAIDAFADGAAWHAKPLDNTDFALGWRKKVARSYLAGALRELRGDDPAALGLLARRAATLLPVVA